MKSMKRVVVTGMGAITPIGNSVEEFWNGIKEQKIGFAPITYFDATEYKAHLAAEVKGFNAKDYMSPKAARRMELFSQYAVAATKEAIEDAGLDLEKEDLNRIGVIFGAGIGGIQTFEEEVKNYATNKENGPKFNPFFIPKMISDIAAGQISIMYGFHGPNFATVSACATSSNAIADAFNYIRLNKANVIVTGGSEAAITEAGVGGFNECTLCQHETRMQQELLAHSAQAAMDSLWVKVADASFWKNWNMPKHVEQKFTLKLLEVAFLLTHIT
jgi:3-oxoacyl-[acyl-carrier-protein] synthase II